jgi:hypothetical protein
MKEDLLEIDRQGQIRQRGALIGNPGCEEFRATVQERMAVIVPWNRFHNLSSFSSKVGTWPGTKGPRAIKDQYLAPGLTIIR